MAEFAALQLINENVNKEDVVVYINGIVETGHASVSQLKSNGKLLLSRVVTMRL